MLRSLIVLATFHKCQTYLAVRKLLTDAVVAVHVELLKFELWLAGLSRGCTCRPYGPVGDGSSGGGTGVIVPSGGSPLPVVLDDFAPPKRFHRRHSASASIIRNAAPLTAIPTIFAGDSGRVLSTGRGIGVDDEVGIADES